MLATWQNCGDISPIPGLSQEPAPPPPPTSHANTLAIFFCPDFSLEAGGGGEGGRGTEKREEEAAGRGGLEEGELLLSRSDRVKRQCRCNLSSMAVWEE